MDTLRIVIFEDNANYRESLLQLFRYTPDVEIVGIYTDGSEAQDAVAQLKPDVVLMDIDMPNVNGIEATQNIKEMMPETQVLMLTVSEEEDRVFQALRNGATGYMLKKAGPDELIESVHQGGSPMSPAIARKVLRYFHADTPTPTPVEAHSAKENFPEDLTPREREILEGLVDGLSYKMIAARYFISADTVKNHIQGIYRKLHVNSKGEAISYVLRRRT
jgi:DNA-binding NarL/FixJ family response regulator